MSLSVSRVFLSALIAASLAETAQTSPLNKGADFRELQTLSDVVILGTVVDSLPFFDGKEPYTDTHFAVQTSFKGGSISTLRVRHHGGPRPDGRVTFNSVSPRFEIGGEAIVFARHRPGSEVDVFEVVGLQAGALEVYTAGSGKYVSSGSPLLSTYDLKEVVEYLTHLGGTSGDVEGRKVREAYRPIARGPRGHELASKKSQATPSFLGWSGTYCRWNTGPVTAQSSWRYDGTANLGGLGGGETGNPDQIGAAMNAWNNLAGGVCGWPLVNLQLAPGYGPNRIHLSVYSMPQCGWTGPAQGSAIGGCTIYTTNGSHSWRGRQFGTITDTVEIFIQTASTPIVDGNGNELLTKLLVHEFGHAIGLDHPWVNANMPEDCWWGDWSSSAMATHDMWGNPLGLLGGNSWPGADDSDAVNFLYNPRIFDPATCQYSGTVIVAGGCEIRSAY